MGIPVKERLGLLIFKFFVFMDIYFARFFLCLNPCFSRSWFLT